MFQNLSTRATLRSLSGFTAAELGNIVFGQAVKPGNQRTGGLVFTVTILNRTTGTLVAGLQGSLDNGATFFSVPFKLDDQTSADLTGSPNLPNGTSNFIVIGPVPAILRIGYVPSAGPDFDGDVETRLYSAGSILGIGQDL